MASPNQPPATTAMSNSPSAPRDNSSRTNHSHNQNQTHNRQPHTHRDDGESSDEAWSGQESVDNNRGEHDDGAEASHNLKRKRPQTISYVQIIPPLPLLLQIFKLSIIIFGMVWLISVVCSIDVSYASSVRLNAVCHACLFKTPFSFVKAFFHERRTNPLLF